MSIPVVDYHQPIQARSGVALRHPPAQSEGKAVAQRMTRGTWNTTRTSCPPPVLFQQSPKLDELPGHSLARLPLSFNNCPVICHCAGEVKMRSAVAISRPACASSPARAPAASAVRSAALSTAATRNLPTMLAQASRPTPSSGHGEDISGQIASRLPPGCGQVKRRVCLVGNATA